TDAEASSWERGTDAPTRACRTSPQATRTWAAPAQRSGGSGTVAAAGGRRPLTRVAVLTGVPVGAGVAVHLGRSVALGGLLGLVLLVALPVGHEMTQCVHQTGRLRVLLAVGFDDPDRVGEPGCVLDCRELSLDVREGGLAVRGRVRGRSTAG